MSWKTEREFCLISRITEKGAVAKHMDSCNIRLPLLSAPYIVQDSCSAAAPFISRKEYKHEGGNDKFIDRASGTL